MRGEVRLAKIEVGASSRDRQGHGVRRDRRRARCCSAALSPLAGVVLLIGDQWLPADRYWLGALIILLVTGGIAAWLARRGHALVSPSQLAPNETVTTLKEDSEWLKQRLTSGATSS